MPAAHLHPLKCRTCGAVVPLGEGDEAHCLACGASTPIPVEYLDLRALRSRDAEQRRAAETLLKRLDRPASLFTKIVARVFDQRPFAFWLVYAGPLILLTIIVSLGAARRWARHLGLHSEDEVPSWQVYLLASTIIFVFVFLPRAIGIYANRRAAGRIRLLAALQARAPSILGVPPSCRACGALLEVEKDALTARCPHCQSENVLAVQTSLRGATRQAVETLGQGLEEAVVQEREEHRALRGKLLSELNRYTLRALSFIVPICIWGWDYDRSEKTGAAPGWGLLSLVFVAFNLIELLYFSGRQKREKVARDPLSGNDVPEWVGWAGPVAFWVILYGGARLFSGH